MIEIYRPTVRELRHMVIDVLGGQWFDSPDFNLNLGAIRNDDEENMEESGDDSEIITIKENTFNDLIYIAWQEKSEQRLEFFTATTDPGYNQRQNPTYHPDKGVGCVREGYYPKVYTLGMHGSREALEQSGPPFMVYRDNDRNKALTLDPSTQEKGWGFKLHYMGDGSTKVNRWSGGCQGPNHLKSIQRIISLVKSQKNAGMGDSVSYSLMRSSWFDADGDLSWAKEDYASIQAKTE